MCGALKDAAWFDNTNAEASQLRDMCNREALRDLTEFLSKHTNGVGELQPPDHRSLLSVLSKVNCIPFPHSDFGFYKSHTSEAI